MALKVEINKKAHKDLVNISRNEAIKILLEIKKLSNFPEVSNIKKLSNFRPSYRKRVGSYRILFDNIDNKNIIYRILHRKDSYK